MIKYKTKKQVLLSVGLFACIIVAVAAILCLLFARKESYISDDNHTKSIDVLYCKTHNLDNDIFFAIDGAENDKHEIKVTYQQNKVNNASYTYSANFLSEKKADEADAILHARYNKYMAQYNLSPSLLGVTFSVLDNKVKINLFADASDFEPAIMKLFFLDEDNTDILEENSVEKLEENYTKKGFDCNNKLNSDKEVK